MLISVVSICYNEEKKIGKTLESVLKQTSLDFEYIIKDGCSCDETNKIVEDFEYRFQRKGIKIKHIIERDFGIYNAMNSAVHYCEGDYILFLNAGDCFVNENVLNNCYKKMEYISADVFYGDAIIEDDSGKAFFRANLSYINKRMPFVHQASFVKKDLLVKYPFNERYTICADYHFFTKLYREKMYFYGLDECICLYEANGVSSTKFLKKRLEHEKILFENNNNSLLSFFYHIIEAIIKEIFLKLLPPFWLSKAKRWYKWKVKKYENYTEEKKNIPMD